MYNLLTKIHINRVALILFAVVALVFGIQAPASAATSPGHVYVWVNPSLSQSNILFSFENSYTGYISQDIIDEDQCAGETGELPGNCAWNTSEPQRMWVNPGWCGGTRVHVYNENTNTMSTNPWNWHIGGSTGKSVWINPGSGLAANYVWGVETQLYPC